MKKNSYWLELSLTALLMGCGSADGALGLTNGIGGDAALPNTGTSPDGGAPNTPANGAVDECTEQDNPCNDDGDGAATCTDTPDGYVCNCAAEFLEVEGACVIANGCVATDNPCDDSGDTAATCSDTASGAQCTCGFGFEDTDGSCQNIDECTVHDNPCDEGFDTTGTCTDTMGGYECGCADGYEGTSGGCLNVDECDPAAGDNPCAADGDSGSTCTDTVGSFDCGCSAGFSETEGGCADLDECTADDNPCDEGNDPSATCTNVAGGYTCGCSDGFADTAGLCINVNECVANDNPCDDEDDPSATCTDTTGGYTCGCNAGFDGTTGTCLVINECADQDNPCDDNGDTSATCDDPGAGFTCTCGVDYVSANGSCFPNDECAIGSNPCDDGGDSGATCNDPGVGSGYECTCSNGFTDTGTGCEDIDECTTQGNPCNDSDDPGATCTNSAGGFSCGCTTDGFDDSTGTCVDIDECATTDPCDDGGDAGSTCTDTDGGYTCGCSAGFENTGGACEDIDECQEQSNPCNDGDDSSATCSNNDGSFACNCSDGFEVDGGVCVDIDECAEQSNPCDDDGDASGSCANNDGGYACTCAAGFDGSAGACAAASCSALLENVPATTTGTYRIDPDGAATGFGPMQATCDMDTDGGGWTLVLNYVHAGGSNPALQVRTDSFPLQGSSGLGVDDSGTDFWGHANNALFASLAATEVRFQASTSLHGRDIDFRSYDAACLAYLGSGAGSCAGVGSIHRDAAGHSANLPDASDDFSIDQGDLALTERPFFATAANYWSVRAAGGAWEVDDAGGDDANDTVHRVWTRSRAPESCAEILNHNPAAIDDTYAIDPDGPTGGAAFDVECDMTTDGGGWTLCGRIDEDAAGDGCVVEAGYSDLVTGTNASFCQEFFGDVAPGELMVHNLTTGDDYGFDDRILVDWSAAPITPGAYGGESVVCTHIDDDGTASDLADCRHSSHQNEGPILPADWQNSVWSFALGRGNSYSGNNGSRVLLGLTWDAGQCDDNRETWRNFGASQVANNQSGDFQDPDNIGDLYLR